MASLGTQKYYSCTMREYGSTYLMRLSPFLMVTVDRSKEKECSLYIQFGKNGNVIDFEIPPKTNEYEIFKPASKERFNQDYRKLVRDIQQKDKTAGEYFLIKLKSKPATGMVWFSADRNNKAGLKIDLDNSPKAFTIRIEFIKTWKNIQHFRRAGHSITGEKFQRFSRGVFDFLHDTDNFINNYHALLDGFSSLVDDHKTDPLENLSEHSNIEFVIAQIDSRISAIENRLRDIDTDSPEERNRLRGELAGLAFSKNVSLGRF